MRGVDNGIVWVAKCCSVDLLVSYGCCFVTSVGRGMKLFVVVGAALSLHPRLGHASQLRVSFCRRRPNRPSAAA